MTRLHRLALTCLCTLLAVPAVWAAPKTPAARPATATAASTAGLTVITTAQGVLPRMAVTTTAALQPVQQVPESDVAVFVNTTQRFQTLVGIGGAITDSTAEVFAKLPADKQQELLTAWFDPVQGLGYSLLRTTIHSSDFSSASYTYVQEGDGALASFNIAHDRVHRLPLVKRALQAAGGRITTFVSPWSAPAFMKTNASLLQGGKLKPEYADSWARYVAKFIQAWQAEGVPIWGLTVQNEPLAKQTWESMIFTAEEERDFLKNHLGPVLRKQGLDDKKIMVWDHNRDLMTQRADVILSDPEAAKYVWGVGYHWYETWAGGEPMVRNVAAVKAAWPKVNLMLTEATIEGFDPQRLQDWANGERYGNAILQDLNAGAVGWTDWNILLDERGGPNHVGNFCFAPVHADSQTGALAYTPQFHYLGHFSKFIRPGATRVSASTSRSSLQATAFRNTDGRVATVVMNTSAAPVRYQLQIDGRQVDVTIPARAIQTLMR